MSAKPIPYGLADYKSLIEEGYAYVDKTMYIRTLEQAGIYHLFLRPRRFGKSLFASMLGYYYDISEKDNFDLLFSNTYIGQNPTKRKNTYYILQFNFSGIRTDSPEIMFESFTRNIHNALRTFCATYHLDIPLEMISPEAQLSTFFTEFRVRCNGKIYVIIDEYDKFANELLAANPSVFEGVVSKDGFVRTWYEVLKRVAGTIVERIFITGVSPITLDSLTSGFNIAKNLSMRGGFNEMMGFTKTEVEYLMKETIPEDLPFDLMDTLTDYYNGYCFSKDGKERVFNSDMVLYYLDYYQQEHKPPDQLLDRNAVSDYGKLEKLIAFQNPERNREILKEIVFDGYTTSKLVDSFSIGQEFEEEHFKSLLFYLGLLTIKETERRRVRLQIPNLVMMGLYADFLRKIIAKETNYVPKRNEIEEAMEQLAYENKIENFIALIEGLLQSISNLDYRNFDEKYIKLAMFAYAEISDLYLIKSEYEVEGGGYIDLVFFPQTDMPELDTLLFELKYIKKEDASKETIEAKRSEALKQLIEYSSAKEFSKKKVTAWALVFAKDECVERICLPSSSRATRMH